MTANQAKRKSDDTNYGKRHWQITSYMLADIMKLITASAERGLYQLNYDYAVWNAGHGASIEVSDILVRLGYIVHRYDMAGELVIRWGTL